VLFGKFRILGKLALLVIVPLLGVVALSVPVIVNRISAAQDAQVTTNTVKLASKVGTAVQELQEERLLSVGYLFNLVQQPELALQSARASDALARVAEDSPDIPQELLLALHNAPANLNNTRQNVLNRAIPPNEVVTRFTAVTTPVINGLGLASHANLTTDVGRQIFALEQALRTDDMISQASGYLTAATITKNAGLVGGFYSILSQIQRDIYSAQVYFTEAQYKLYLGAQDAFQARVGKDFLAQAGLDPLKAVQGLDIKTLFPSLRSVLVLGGFVEKRVAADVNAIVSNTRSTALRDALLIGGGSLLLLFIVIALSMFMARAVARPLRRLTMSADLVARAAETELERVADDDAESVRPIRLEAVDVEAEDEIGDLARAFDRVQTTAVRLVERQVLGRRNVAQMFAHVGRRTQNLVGRQLALIDSLERRETDGDRLGELYRLDHMSSRLRRNASSLVVLSGGAGADEHMAPLPLSDVVRLALGEIEDYPRVDVDVPEEIVVVPAILADLILLLAELMENATSFSPPHTRVVITGGQLRGGARLAIIDQGLGMPPERLAEENTRLTRRERLDLAPSEVLGLFVVGRLARRHGIEVALTETSGGGVTAWIDLAPAHLVAHARTGLLLAGSDYPNSEFAQVIAGSAARSSVPGSQQPFDPHVIERATRILETGHSWDAFAPPRPDTAAIEGEYLGQPVYDGEPVYSQRDHQQPASYQQPVYQQRVTPAPFVDFGAPIAGRIPAALSEPPTAGPGTRPQAPGAPTWNTPSAETARTAPPIPRQRVEEDYRYGPPVTPVRPRSAPPAVPSTANPPLRRRVPGDQIPAERGTPSSATPPSQDDATAARTALDAFEAGVNRAQWDAAETDMSSPPSAGHVPLARRVPGATLPADEPETLPPPVASPPLDPDAARALMEQFEYGVALALKETQPQPEGQPR
jgi:signal transduction histidine kinase